ncbi:hypothetical protein SDC9_181810 [bioreactor metagenome]|uniref:Uncharacterized protein n=1 Tax=bioreactor metagenome TaxID=1076179 RepID=A0A645H5N7_9ZZZZ
MFLPGVHPVFFLDGLVGGLGQFTDKVQMPEGFFQLLAIMFNIGGIFQVAVHLYRSVRSTFVFSIVIFHVTFNHNTTGGKTVQHLGNCLGQFTIYHQRNLQPFCISHPTPP